MRNLVSTWAIATPDQRRELLRTIVEEIRADADGVASVRIREGWLPYVPRVAEGPTERKTGLLRAVGTRTLEVNDAGDVRDRDDVRDAVQRNDGQAAAR